MRSPNVGRGLLALAGPQRAAYHPEPNRAVLVIPLPRAGRGPLVLALAVPPVSPGCLGGLLALAVSPDNPDCPRGLLVRALAVPLVSPDSPDCPGGLLVRAVFPDNPDCPGGFLVLGALPSRALAMFRTLRLLALASRVRPALPRGPARERH
jgi:hypothetical protein